MKKVLVLATFLLFANTSFAYTLYPVGQIQADQWNSFANKFYPTQIKVYAGHGKNIKHIQFEIVQSVGKNIEVNYVFEKCSQRDIDKNRCDADGYKPSTRTGQWYTRILDALDKSIEWSNIALQNSVRISKNIPVLDGEKMRGYNGSYEYVQFFANTEHNKTQTSLVIPFRNQIKSDHVLYIDLDNQEIFKELLTTQSELTIAHALANANNSDLFQ